MDTKNEQQAGRSGLDPAEAGAELSRIHHAMNNPLAVISGNVQLLQELIKALDLGAELDGPLNDIAMAVDQLHDGTDRLVLLKELLSSHGN